MNDNADDNPINHAMKILIEHGFGGYAEYIYWPAEALVQVPENLNPAEAVTLILNYLVAYQILHRVVCPTVRLVS